MFSHNADHRAGIFFFFLFFLFSVVVALAGLELTEGPTASASLVLEIKV